ncbi:MAG TPA: hypothetical protein VHS34_06645 [Terriglobales bacterium]|jgi:hypothetical protein|nr:hypothetical protein [Terriglobales bacterium]
MHLVEVVLPKSATESFPARGPMSQVEVLSLALLTCVVFVSVISSLSSYPRTVDDFGDSSAYMSVASAIRRWDFQGLTVKQFWGLPYLMALVSTLLRVSDRTSLLLISAISSLVSVALAYRLWGGWVAGFFAVLNFDWIQRSFLGGSEPLFVALLFFAFVALREQRWILAALSASLATTVRPLGILALLALGVVLLERHEYRKVVLAFLVGCAIGIAYMLPLWRIYGDPLATVHSYQQANQAGPHLFGVPFHAILKGTLLYHSPWTNLLLTFGWIFFVLAGVVAMIASQAFREYAKTHPVEVIFAGAYLLAICSYNYPYWARGSFPRFAIPVIPLVILALSSWISKSQVLSRVVLWGLGVISPLLAAASALGVRNVLPILHH